MYGQTECAPRISCFDLVKHPLKIGSVGHAIDCCAVSIERKEATNVGEICITGKNVFSGYAENFSDLLSNKRISSFHRTGDLGCVDKEGFIFIKGRKKRFVKIYGSNVNLDHLQLKLQEIHAEVVVTGTDNKITLFFIGSAFDENLIKNEINKNTTINTRAVLYKKIEEIPRLSNGKINFEALEDQK